MAADPVEVQKALGSKELNDFIAACVSASGASTFFQTVADSEKDPTDFPDMHIKIDPKTAKALCWLMWHHRVRGEYQKALDPAHKYDMAKLSGAVSYAVKKQFEFELTSTLSESAKDARQAESAQPRPQGGGTMDIPGIT